MRKYSDASFPEEKRALHYYLERWKRLF